MQAVKQIERQVEHWMTSGAGPTVIGSMVSRLIAIGFTGLINVAMLATSLVALPLVAVLAASNSALALALDDWQFDSTTEQLVITVPKGVTPRYHLMAEPARIVLDLPNAEVGTVPMQQSYSGAVRQIRVAQFQPNLARIVLELSSNTVLAADQVMLEPIQDSETATTQRWALRPLLATVAGPAANPVASTRAAATVPEIVPGTASDMPSKVASEVSSGARPNALSSNRSDVPMPESRTVETVGEASASAQIASAQVETQPAQPTQPAQAAPPVIEFSMPLPTSANHLTDSELTEATGTAAALSTDARSTPTPNERTASTATSIGPSTGTLSFPTPTADAIQVPSVSTVNNATVNSANAVNPAREDSISSADPAHLTSKPAIPASALPFGQPFPNPGSLVARSETQPEAQSEAQPETQPEAQPQGQSEPRLADPASTARRSNRSATQQPARPQPTQPAVTQPNTAQPVAQPSPSTIEVIPFGQPLPR
jgi:hypothetical protein